MRSPIDIMIDEATGYAPGPSRKSRRVLLRCPGCGAEKPAGRHPSDPADAAVVVASCPVCGDPTDIKYLDKSGEEVE